MAQLNHMEYDGTFELAFLRNDEGVRSQGRGDASIQIERNGEVVARAGVGDWLHRQGDGSIAVVVMPRCNLCGKPLNGETDNHQACEDEEAALADGTAQVTSGNPATTSEMTETPQNNVEADI